MIPPGSIEPPRLTAAAAASYSTLRWVIRTPFGLPVVPDVYSTVTMSSGPTRATRRATASGSAASRRSPAAANSAQLRYGSSAGQAAGSRTMIFLSPGSEASTGRHRASSGSPSSTAIRASQSCAV